jgi:hypothetical protein
MIEFPKMLYRPRAIPNQDLGGLKMDTLVVDSASEEAQAVRQGWYLSMGEAAEQIKKLEKGGVFQLKLRATAKHPAAQAIGAAALALFVAFLTKLFGWN